jgi:Type II secretion system (T2SS), protein M subtype b
MSRQRTVDIGSAALGGLLAAIGAVAICVVLAALARPAHFKARIATVGGLVQRTERVAARPGDPGAYPAQALCDSASVAASEDAKTRIAAAANAAGVTLSNVNADIGAPAEQLTPIKLSFAVSGRYDAAMTLLNNLSKAQPSFFVDRVDLKSDTSSVELKITGNIYCWTSDHP